MNASERPIKVLLVDDQEIVYKTLEALLESERDIEVLFCSDPLQALDLASEFKPTVILQDLIMPQIDGLTLVRYYRANDATKDVPLVVLSSKEESAVKAEAFALGANDYLVKLPEREELIARIRYHSKGYIHQLERNEAYQKLEQSENALRGELVEAADYVRTLLPKPLVGDVSTYWKFIPSQALGGDAFGYHWIDNDTFSLYLLDVCGHGVGAALLSISIANVIGSGAVPGEILRSPKQMLAYLNETFPMERHNGMFFTLWYGIYHKKERRLTYASGGHPPALLISEGRLEPLSTKGVLIGGLEGQSFSEESQGIPPASRLLIYSDGAFELERPDGTRMTLEEFFPLVSAAAKSGDSFLDVLEKSLVKERGKDLFDDDFSLLEVVFD
ncbi:MAG: fused response regulator/phosphatase [Chlamydiia bacterium]|nr:fused response regulator/phosphatase [Chlamydiia bacterium]